MDLNTYNNFKRNTGRRKWRWYKELREQYARDIKTIIQELNQKIDELTHRISELQRKNNDLDEQNQRMLSILVYSKPVVEFLNRSDNDYSLSSDKDNVKILAMIAYAFFMLYILYQGVGKLLTGELNELVHVPRMAAAAAQDEPVSIPELKKA